MRRTAPIFLLLLALATFAPSLAVAQVLPTPAPTQVAPSPSLPVQLPDLSKSENPSSALQPYLNKQIDQKVALDRALVPIRRFMWTQIDRAGNDEDVDVFTDAANLPRATDLRDVPTTALIPAFMLSELKVAFAMGFKIL